MTSRQTTFNFLWLLEKMYRPPLSTGGSSYRLQVHRPLFTLPPLSLENCWFNNSSTSREEGGVL